MLRSSMIPTSRQIKEDEMGGACGTNMRDVYNILVEKSKEELQIGKPKVRWQSNNKIILKLGLNDVYWIHLAQNRDHWWVVLNTAINHRFV
jgi:hypothetical protein